MQIQLTKDFLGNSAGQRLEVADHDAQTLLAQGIAQATDNDPLGPVLQRSIQPALESSIEKALAKVLQQRAAGRGGHLPFAGLGDQIHDDPKAGFKNFGDFALAVRDACMPGKRIDERLQPHRQKSPAGHERRDLAPDGGFLVPTHFAQKILGKRVLRRRTTSWR